MSKIDSIVSDEIFAWMKEIRRKLHQWPELGFREEKTAGLISEELNRLGISHRTGVARTGIVGRLVTDGSGPTVALRADMDALPISENTGLPFSSQNPGVMHACGHDGHVAIVLGAAAILKANPPEGNAVFIFQPAEESEGGAKPMIEQGALEGVDMIFGGHIERHHHVGEIGIKTGVHTSFTDSFEINITGKGGHAARPHEAIDAVLIASQFVINIQAIVSREVDPLHPSVITIGHINAGTVHNAIAETGVLKGTIRTTNEQIRTLIIGKIERLASSLAALSGAEIKVRMNPGYPPVINDDRAVEIARHASEELVGKDSTVSIPLPSLGGEDFAYYLQKIPGCFVRFGAAKAGHELLTSHSPRFDFDEDVLKVGAAYLSELVRYTVKKLKEKG